MWSSGLSCRRLLNGLAQSTITGNSKVQAVFLWKEVHDFMLHDVQIKLKYIKVVLSGCVEVSSIPLY